MNITLLKTIVPARRPDTLHFIVLQQVQQIADMAFWARPLQEYSTMVRIRQCRLRSGSWEERALGQGTQNVVQTFHEPWKNVRDPNQAPQDLCHFLDARDRGGAQKGTDEANRNHPPGSECNLQHLLLYLTLLPRSICSDDKNHIIYQRGTVVHSDKRQVYSDAVPSLKYTYQDPHDTLP